MKKPLAVYLLVLLHIFLGVSAVTGGALLIADTNGSLLGMEPGWLKDTPFSGYLIPGLLLLFLNGVFPLLVAAGLLITPSWKWLNRINIYKQQHWAWTCSLFAGITVIAWIIFQQFLTSYFWLQPFIAATGLLIIILTMMPGVMDYYRQEFKKGKLP